VPAESPLRKPRIAIFDYSVRPDSAMGGCHLWMLAGLADKYDFTVFAVEFENPAPSKIKFVRIPAFTRPTILLSLTFHLLAPVYYCLYRLKHWVRFDLVQKMEVFTFLGSVAYVHFCYRAYLSKHWRSSRQPGLRGFLLSLDQALRGYILEPVLYRFARTLVVPSRGLARELIGAYPFTERKIYLLPNSADYAGLSTIPPGFDRENFRAQLDFSPDDLVLVFIALGQFERKGLPQLLEAIALVGKANIKLLIVGGSQHWIEQYGARAEELKIGRQIAFAGMQRDVGPFLWAGDVFTLPSLYEVFPLVVIEAAAASRPPLVTHLNGVEDFIEDGTSGIYVERTPESIAIGIRTMDSIGQTGRDEMGKCAQRAAKLYTREAFVANWDKFIEEQVNDGGRVRDTQYERAEHA
jgi:glycosyltransferase involved in cell wall biosynthesis